MQIINLPSGQELINALLGLVVVVATLILLIARNWVTNKVKELTDRGKSADATAAASATKAEVAANVALDTKDKISDVERRLKSTEEMIDFWDKQSKILIDRNADLETKVALDKDNQRIRDQKYQEAINQIEGKMSYLGEQVTMLTEQNGKQADQIAALSRQNKEQGARIGELEHWQAIANQRMDESDEALEAAIKCIPDGSEKDRILQMVKTQRPNGVAAAAASAKAKNGGKQQ